MGRIRGRGLVVINLEEVGAWLLFLEMSGLFWKGLRMYLEFCLYVERVYFENRVKGRGLFE